MARTGADDVVRFLLERKPCTGLIDRKTGLPYGLSLWLRNVADRYGAPTVTVAPQAIVDALLERPAPPPRSSLIHRDAGWHACAALLRQQWDPPPADERPLRRRAVFVTVCVHLFYAGLLLWLALVRLMPPLPEDDEGSRTRIEFVGAGTPDVPGGGAPGGDASARPGQETPATSKLAGATAASGAPSPAAVQVDASAASAPEPPASPAAQPVQVSEASAAPADYVLPPTAVATSTVALPDVKLPETHVPAVRETEVTVVDVQALAVTHPAPSLNVPVRRPDAVPQVRQREVAVVERPDIARVDVPLRVPRTVLPPRPLAVPQREVAVQMREPQPAPAASSPVAPAAAATSSPASAQVTAASAASTPESPARAASATAQAAGRSPAPVTAASDGWAKTRQRADDWGAASRNRPGSLAGAPAGRDGAGLFDRDGRARLPAGDAQSGRRGAPGGDADRWTRDRLDSAGTWLKRPPYDYDPTSFDKYWVPNESVLEQWVRQGIKDISIPIPGTGKRLHCVVSLLQLGGGCGIADPNLNDQPAVARPPPDIPFKPGLQEDNGSVKPGRAPTRP